MGLVIDLNADEVRAIYGIASDTMAVAIDNVDGWLSFLEKLSNAARDDMDDNTVVLNMSKADADGLVAALDFAHFEMPNSEQKPDCWRIISIIEEAVNGSNKTEPSIKQ